MSIINWSKGLCCDRASVLGKCPDLKEGYVGGGWNTNSVRDNVLEQKVCDVIQEIGVDICDRDIQACHRLKDKDQTIVKFTNRKDCLQILMVKRQLKGLILQRWTCLKEPKFLLIRACALTIEGYGTNEKN